MTGIERAKDALKVAREALAERRGYCESWEYKYAQEWNAEDAYIQAVITDLEKPASDLEKVVTETLLLIYRDRDLPRAEESKKRIIELIQQYAESYHAAKCAECGSKCLAPGYREAPHA